MTKPIFAAFAMTTLAAPSAVTLSFDSDLEGFTVQPAVTSIAWSPVNGGSMRMEDTGAWGGNGAQLKIHDNPAMWAELQLAVVNGGTISYDFIVVDADQDYSAPPRWFETVIIGSSGPTNWDQNIIMFGIGSPDWPLNHTYSVSISIPPTVLAGVANDDEWFVDLTDGWANLHIGMSCENNGTLTKSVVYFDNITLDAVPEPSVFLFSVLSVGVFLRRRSVVPDQ